MPRRLAHYLVVLALLVAALGAVLGGLTAVLEPGPPPIPTTDHGTGTP